MRLGLRDVLLFFQFVFTVLGYVFLFCCIFCWSKFIVYSSFFFVLFFVFSGRSWRTWLSCGYTFGFSPFLSDPLKSGITACYDSLTCPQAAIDNTQMCCFIMWSHVASGVNLGRYILKINHPTKLLTEIEVFLFILHS